MQPDISKSFGDDFRSKYEAYLGIVESGTSPSPRLVVADYGTLPSVLEDLAAAVQLAGMPKGLPREHEEALFGKYLPAIFAALLKRKLVSHVLLRARFKDDIVKATIALFCCWMAARLPTLGQKSLTDARTLDSIFRFKSRFFDLNGLDILVTDLEGVVAGRFKMPGGLTAYVTHDYQNVRSKVVRFLVDCFGKLGGFEFVHSAIADSEPKAEELAPMTRWLKAVGSMAEYLNKEVANEVCVPVCLAAKEYLGRMKEAELPLVKIVELKKFIKHVKKICRFCKQERVQDIVGDLELTVATQFLAVFSTEKRVAAIDLILQRVRALKDRFPPKHVLEKEKKDNEGYRLAKWLEQRKLVETLFAGAMQADVIKKMAPVLELMYSWRCLAIDAVLMIWGQAAEAGTGLQTAMFQALEGVLTRLSERDAKIFFEIFRGFPADKYTEEAAKILSALLKNEYSRGKAGTADRSHPTTEAANDPEPGFILSSEETVPSPLKPDEVLEFVWGLAQSKEYSRLGMPIQTAIVESLVTTLQECYRGKLAKYARRCEENIVKSSGFVPCSRIFQRLATSLVEKPAVSHFFERVTLGLLGFKKSAAELAAPKISGCASKSQPGTENGGDNPMELGEEDHKCCASPAREHIYESLAINGFPYYSELEERLELLGFMLRTYKQDLPGTYIDMLWKVFLTNSFSEKEATIFFRFMKKLICTSRGVEFIAAGLFDTFTFDVLLKLAEADYSETALDCLVNILIPMNAHYGHIKILKDDKVELADTKLIGIGGLWGVAFRAGSHDVRHKAADRLVDLYTHLAAELTGAERLGVAKDFVAKCMHELQAEKDKENECAQVLALEMLEKYMKSREEDSAHQPPPPPKDFCLSIKYWTDTVQIKVNENTRVSEALQMGFLALKMTKQIESLRYVSDGREIYPTDDPLSIYGIFGPTLIEIKEDYQMYNLLSVPLLNNRDSVPMNDDTASAASLEQLKSMFSDLPARLVEAALKRANGDLERAVECLTNPAESQALLSELGITEDLTKRKPSEAPQGTKLDLICGPGYSHFSALYGLLGSDNPTVASKAWELVSALRVNDDFFHRVQAFRTAEDYETTLKSASPHQLAYILRAIEKALRSPEDRWLASWATSGGFRLLWGRAEGFLGKEEGGRSDIVLRCVEAVLRIAREAVEFMVEVRRPEIYKEYVAMKKGFNKNCCQDAALKSVKEVVTEEFVKRLKPTEMFGTISRVMSSFLESEMSFASALHQGLHLLHLLPYLDPACEAQIWTGSAAYPELVAAILLRAQNEAVQDQLVFELQTMLSLLCKVAKHPDTRIDCLSLLLRLLRDSAGDLGPHFFSLLDGLLDVYSGTPCCCANTVDTTLAHRIPLSKPDLVTLLIHRIGSSSSPQPGLGGHIRILAKFVRSEEKTVSLLSEPEAAAVTECLLGEIFGPRVCESKEILDYAIPLLSMIVKAAPGIFPRVSRAVVGFNAKHSSAASGTGETAKTNAARAVNGYVGLENFGCTCYINSLFQQLYMMPRFRDKILNLNVTELEKAKDGDRVTLNLRAIFAALQSSERQYYAPKEFCDSFRFRHGKVIDTHVQEDVDEFFTHLASRLEDELKSAGLPQAANEELGMVLQSRISSLEKGLHYVSVTESPQLALPLNIKGSKSVQECLDAFFKEEILDGDNKYYCEDYKKQIKVSKRCAIKSLSNTVVISLKRFDCTLTKLNDYCEFPDRLNFFRWSSDGQGLHPDSPAAGNYDYQLVGVLIHSGTALTGHYFSYIKERATTSPNCGVWFEFNDTMVKPCEYGQVVSQAFGGPSHGGNCTSAYLLFYEKLEGAEDKSSAAVTKPRFARLPIDDPQEYREFMLSCLEHFAGAESSAAVAAEPETCPLAPRPLVSICAAVLSFIRELAAKPDTSLQKFLAAPKQHCETSFQIAVQVLEYFARRNEKTLFELIVAHHAAEVREGTGQLMSAAWATVARRDPELAAEFAKLVLTGGLTKARKNWESFDQFFNCIKRFCLSAPANAITLVKSSGVYQMINFISNQPFDLRSRYNNFCQDRMGDVFSHDANFSVPISILSILVRCCSTEAMRKSGTLPPGATLCPLGQMAELPTAEVEYLFSYEARYLDWTKQNSADIANMLAHLCYKDEARLRRVVKEINGELVCLYGASEAARFFTVLQALVDLDPKLGFEVFVFTETRSYPSLLKYIKNETFVSDLMVEIIRWIADQAQRHEVIRQIIKVRRPEFSVLIDLLDSKLLRAIAYDVDPLKALRQRLLSFMDQYTEEQRRKETGEQLSREPEPWRLPSLQSEPVFVSAPVKAASIFEPIPEAKKESKKEEAKADEASEGSGKEPEDLDGFSS